ncbi:Mei5p KNAG_0H01500 [Huiozyma naganishii CBS 8797]|uniref:Meiosis protein 5 n=1 Tax=Huiozyma naganishii (strain ATCC MYA-139 / BCRC 22969 / CBS 8797 / KCTC 17520 / NBRC 10181 / NCYC 3082 / Yp74L-3) TaxID=1071383 RepID=J7S8I9_HUIN7|nr:hypothetical protein KNAG_0H01500 [Kazachstania naganishii CBS 8797]CCK71564.1 hypothetical protein KNAG_0H01500 [Kazachstania naganishii CBS 8797]
MDETTLIGDSSPVAGKGASAAVAKVRTPFRSPLARRKGAGSSDAVGRVSKRVPPPDGSSIESAVLYKEVGKLVAELDRQTAAYSRKTKELQDAIKVMESPEVEAETRALIDKWRAIAQGAVSYLLNSVLGKIDRLGGYEEFRRKELEREKRQLEYRLDNGFEDEMESVLESEEFNGLPEDLKEEYRETLDGKKSEFEQYKTKQFAQLDAQLDQVSKSSQQMDMREMCKRLNVDYSLVFDAPAEQ